MSMAEQESGASGADRVRPGGASEVECSNGGAAGTAALPGLTRNHFSLTDQAIDAAALAAELQDPAAGAIVTFDGRVRNHNAGRAVARLEYQAYPALAVRSGTQILSEIAAAHGVLRVRAVHRTGPLEIGDCAVWVGVASAHRAAAFDAARALMERLKYELPVWKKETYADGTVEWVGPDNTSPETGALPPEMA